MNPEIAVELIDNYCLEEGLPSVDKVNKIHEAIDTLATAIDDTDYRKDKSLFRDLIVVAKITIGLAENGGYDNISTVLADENNFVIN